MNSVPSVAQLKRAIKLVTQLEKLQKELDSLWSPQAPSPARGGRRTSYSLTPQGSARIAEAQRRRWVRFRQAKKASKIS